MPGSREARGERAPRAVPGGAPSWGDLRPRRACRWEEVPDGGVVLLRPRFGEGWLGRRLEALFQPRPIKVRLDRVGSFVWERCDGGTRVETIARAMREEFGGKVEPVEDRLVTFLGSLVRAGCVRLGGGGA